MKTIVPIVAVCLAVIAASYAAVSYYKDKAAIARDEAAKAASEEETELAKARAAKDSLSAERAKESEAKEKLRIKQEEHAIKAAAVEQARLEQENLKLKAQEAADSAKAAADYAQAQADIRAAKEAELKTKKAEAAKAQAEAQLEAEVTAGKEAMARKEEAESLKLKTNLEEVAVLKDTYERWLGELNDYKRELDEREAAMHPDLTAEDLFMLGEEEKPGAEAEVLPENDRRLTKGERELARMKRLQAEAQEASDLATREEIENRLTALMRQAIKEDRVPDAKFYYRTLKSFYPDWEYKEEEVKE